jgi:hypothetical protein
MNCGGWWLTRVKGRVHVKSVMELMSPAAMVMPTMVWTLGEEDDGGEGEDEIQVEHEKRVKWEHKVELSSIHA